MRGSDTGHKGALCPVSEVLGPRPDLISPAASGGTAWHRPRAGSDYHIILVIHAQGVGMHSFRGQSSEMNSTFQKFSSTCTGILKHRVNSSSCSVSRCHCPITSSNAHSADASKTFEKRPQDQINSIWAELQGRIRSWLGWLPISGWLFCQYNSFPRRHSIALEVRTKHGTTCGTTRPARATGRNNEYPNRMTTMSQPEHHRIASASTFVGNLSGFASSRA